MDVKVTADQVHVVLDFSVAEFKTLVSMLGAVSTQDWINKTGQPHEEVIALTGDRSLYERLFEQARTISIL